MKKKCIILVFNKAYLEKAKNTINLIRDVGQYNGDIVCIVGDDLIDMESEIVSFSKNIIYKYFPDIDRKEIIEILSKNNFDYEYSVTKNFQFHKFYCFHPFFKENYEKCLYIDCGMQIFKPIDKIINLDCRNLLLAHSDTYPLYNFELEIQFDKTVYEDLHSDVSEKYNLNRDYFQSTLMLYDPKIILEDTLEKLIELSKVYFNSRTNDQAILNLYFLCIRNIWQQITINDNETFYYDYTERYYLDKSQYIMLKLSLT